MADYLKELATLIGSLTTIGGALMYLYNRFVGKPRERRRMEEADRRARERDEYLAMLLDPLRKSIDDLNRQLEGSKRDTDTLKLVAEKNTLRIDKLDDDMIKVKTTLKIDD